MNFFSNYFNDLRKLIEEVNPDSLVEISNLISDVKQIGKKIILIGNGGSAAICSHVSVDFTKAANIRAINFNEAALITCFANDYGYENWASKALEAYANQGDLVILISSSGKSKNIINAAIIGRSLGLNVVTLSGFDSNNELRKLGNINLYVESSSYNYVEMTHHIWLLAIVDYLIKLK